MDTTKGITFSLSDSSGGDHPYEMYFHPAGEGFKISVELVQVLGEPLLRALGDLADVAEEAIAANASGEAGAGEGLLGDIDLAGAMGALRSLNPDVVVDLGKRLLSKTSRDGKWLKGHEFDTAYRGNYTELYEALWKIIEANQFIPFLGTFSADPGPE